MPNSVTTSHQPKYIELVRFLLTPLLESPERLRIDCETTNNNQRVWIRLALEETDQGKILGRGGRNLNAVRTVLKTAAAVAGQSVYLDVYGLKEATGREKRTQSSGESFKETENEGKKKVKPQKRSKPSPKRSSSPLTPNNS